MKILICGGGRIADEFLKRLSENWQITLVEIEANKLGPFSERFPSVSRVIHGDASSPVVLEDAGLVEHDYIVILTDNDEVNLAIAQFALERRVRHVMVVVRNPDMLDRFNDLDIWTVLMNTVVANKIYQHIQDPRVNVIDLGQGEGELLEMDLDEIALGTRRVWSEFNGHDFRLVGLLRDHRLIFPDDSIQPETGDRLLILGKSGLFKTFCEMLDCDQPHFPKSYGQVLALGLIANGNPDKTELLNETLYLAQNTKTGKMTVVCEKAARRVRDQLDRWSASLNIEIRETNGDVESGLLSVADAGLVVIPPISTSFLSSLARPVIFDLAHALSCPLLIARGTQPYERILVPFNGSALSRLALETAVDMARQMDARVAAVIVEEPDFIHGENSGPDSWRHRMLKQVREVAKIHKFDIEEHVREGNPPRQILDLAPGFNLMVIGSTRREKGIFSPNVGDILMRQSPATVLVLTS